MQGLGQVSSALEIPISPPRVDSSKGPNRVNRAHWPTKENIQQLNMFLFSFDPYFRFLPAQVERANQAELVFLDAQDEIGRLKQQLTQERINRVSNQYTPVRGGAAVAAPRIVITCGWLRDFNAALGATAPAPPGCRAYAGSQEAAWPAPGSDAELLESGVTAADILAHARDYGAWALANLAQLNALIDLHDKDKP